jgi:FkbM family methyltransferase
MMTKQHPDERLEAILSESVASARERECRAFDEAAGPFAQSLVLYGAGNLGRNVLRGLRKNGMDAIAFADANPVLSGKLVEGVPVFSPEDAARKFGKNAAFVVCVWHPDRQHSIQHIMANLAQLGADRVTSFVPLFWKYSSTFLPYFFWDLPSKFLAERAAIEHCYSALSDEASKTYFVDNLGFRADGDFRQPSSPSELPAYFPRELFHLSADECFVDCGAFDGDTIQAFLGETHGVFRRIVAFEPDPRNHDALQRNFLAADSLRSRAVIHKAAVGASKGKVRFNATGLDNAAVTNDGELEIECTTLDESLQGENPTFIKMDIEGSERGALSGGKGTIRSSRPVLAVSVYHRPEDLWTLPLYMSELNPGSHLSLRMYWHDGFDLVCFAVPSHRVTRFHKGDERISAQWT